MIVFQFLMYSYQGKFKSVSSNSQSKTKNMSRKQSISFSTLAVATIFSLGACNNNDEEPGDHDMSVFQEQFYGTGLSWSMDETTITITTKDLPDHKSMYWPTSNSLYETYDEPTNADFKKNPNQIESQSYTFKIPRYPSAASKNESTDYDAFGVAVNGVVFFNQNAAPGDDILEELNTFDQYEGHPQNRGVYHYHIEPVWLTATQGSDAFLGFLLDGFPVYGPIEDGKTMTNADLDEFHGHTSATSEFPDGVYHYHFTADLPWINGGEYYGTPGTKTN
jgi:hypothetical protein